MLRDVQKKQASPFQENVFPDLKLVQKLLSSMFELRGQCLIYTLCFGFRWLKCQLRDLTASYTVSQEGSMFGQCIES